MHIQFTTSFLFCFLILNQFQLVGQNDNLDHEIGLIIQYDANIDFDVVPGVLVGVIDGDSTYVSAFGENLSPDSLYELGSVSKPFAAWLVNQALDSLGWNSNESICLFLPDSICDDHYQNLTFDDVLQHRCGLPRLPLAIGENDNSSDDPYAAYDEYLLANDLMQLVPSSGTYSYSHVGYAMWYWLFNKVGGLDDFSTSRISEQLHLTNTFWYVDDTMVAQGYGLDGRPNPVWHCQSLSSALGLKSSLNDIMDFIRIISPALAAANSVNFKEQKKEINSLRKKGEYKVVDGWFLVQYGSSIIYFHTGRSGGHHVSIAFIPELMKGVVVIANSSMGSNELSLLVLEMIRRRKG